MLFITAGTMDVRVGGTGGVLLETKFRAGAYTRPLFCLTQALFDGNIGSLQCNQ